MAAPTVPAPVCVTPDRNAVISSTIEPTQSAQGRRRAGPEAGGEAERPAGPEGAGLGTYAKNAATAGQGPDERAREKRAEKYAALRALVQITTLPRVRKCKRVSRIEGGEVHLRCGHKASIAGLVTCGSVWVCPVCSAVISSHRAHELDKLITWNVDRGGSLALLTLTMRHHRGHTLRQLRTGFSGAWRHVGQSRAWKDAKKRLGMDGYVRAIEVTDGEAGWHLHAHLLLVFVRPIDDVEIHLLEEAAWSCWSTGLEREGFSAIREVGVDIRRGDEALEQLGRYINKIVFETVGGRWKKGRRGGRTPFEILADGLATGLADDLERWFEWEQGSKGMQQLRWSTHLKKRVGVDEIDDEELAERIEPGVTIARLPRPTWARVYREGQEHLLDHTEQHGPEGAYEWLRARDLPFTPVDPDAGLYGESVADEPTSVVAARLREAAGIARRNERVMDLYDRLDARQGMS